MLVLKLCEQLCPDKIPVETCASLGGGADGEVFEIKDDPNKVIKFCVLYQTGKQTIQNTYKYTCKVLDYLIKTPMPTYATVYSYDVMGQFTRPVTWSAKGQPYILYYYTMEKLSSITEDESKVFHSIVSHEDRGIDKNFSSAKVKEMISGMATCLDFDAERVTFFCENFKNTLVEHQDVHVRNIMKDPQGNFKLVDFDRAQLRR